ncbi:Epoxide hydrolase domain protein [Mycena sanguinolenta]|uniref:Epoxide hydrolase domain protein n=1 Tax=Mycena sanguinolenta TaxID=230812 RepID=A0A8H6ZMY3_9AGAR|nr:Epoxide hydrolase domain protein [Mycena sanguinolenta]
MIFSSKVAICLVGATTFATTSAANSSFNMKPFKISLTNQVARMKALVTNTHLPAQPLYPNAGFEKGIELDFLRELQSEWMTGFDWESQEAELNQFDHYTAEIEGQTVHFIHEISTEPDAIPLILLHGWPGSFQEFAPVIKPLTQPWTNPSGKSISYNVVVPSLPGFVFSSAPPANWTIDDTARIFNTLMTDVLGYSTYTLHGTDWGSAVGYSLYSFYSLTVRAAHFVFLPFLPPSGQELASNNITLPAQQNVTEQRYINFSTSGMGYFKEQTNKPNDIGLALHDNPVGQLAWMGSHWKTSSDPRAGTLPSVLNNTAILTSVSLYYLTRSFLSSVWIYAENPNGFNTNFSKASTDAPMLFSQFEYNIVFWPEEWVAQVGNLVSYKFHDFGGHFAGLDNPPALIEDIREMGLYFI